MSTAKVFIKMQTPAVTPDLTEKGAADTSPLSLNNSPSSVGVRFHFPTSRLILWGLICLGVLLTLLNLRWPVARNALDYAKQALDIVEHHFNIYAVVRDQARTGGKPILFSVLAAPFVWAWSANTAVILASALGTAFFLWTVSIALPRLNQRMGLDPSLEPLELILTAFNPLVLYQFWSGYPDSLFAGLVVLSFVLLDIIASEPERDTRRHIVALGVTILAAVHTKLYGAMLCFAGPVYLLMHSRQLLRRSTVPVSKIVIVSGIFLVLGLALVLAKFAANPLLILDPNAGANDYFSGLSDTGLQDVKKTLLALGFTLVLTFQASLLFIPTRGARSSWSAPPTVFAVIYVLGLLPASGASFNIRYFLPVFPFLAPVIAAGTCSIVPAGRRMVLTTYATLSCVLVLNFNVSWVERILEPITAPVFIALAGPAGWLDNLRLPVQMALKRQIDAINTKVPDGGTLYWSSHYYGTATHGLAHHLGVKKDLDVQYVLEPSDPRPSIHTEFLTLFTTSIPRKQLWRVPDWATVTSLGDGLFRLDPISVKLVSVSGDYVSEADAIRIQAEVLAGEGLKPGPLEFFDGNRRLEGGPQSPSELILRQPTQGRHAIWAQIAYGKGSVATSIPIVVYVGYHALERSARATNDITVEARDSTIETTEEDLSLDPSDRSVAIRFTDIQLPHGARISEAYLQFVTASPAVEATTLTICGELSPRVDGLTLENGDLSRRVRTQRNTKWELFKWVSSGEIVRSPNLAPIIEEVVAQQEWKPQNPVTLLIRTLGRGRLVQAVDMRDHRAPVLYIALQQ